MGRGLFCSLISIAHALDVVASQENSYTVQMLRLMLEARMGGGIRFNMRKQSAGERSEQRLRSSPLLASHLHHLHAASASCSSQEPDFAG